LTILVYFNVSYFYSQIGAKLFFSRAARYGNTLFGGVNSVDRSLRHFTGFTECNIQKANGSQSNNYLDTRNNEHGERPLRHFLLSKKVGLFAAFFALIAVLISSLFVGERLYYVLNDKPERSRIKDRWWLAGSLLICGGLLWLFLWLCVQTEWR
jgi:hypothetical protein